MKPLEDETGWDVFSLEYKLCAPLTTIFSDREMGRYSRSVHVPLEVEKSRVYAVRVVEIHETDSCVAITTRRFRR